jgi:predicted nucleotidyltransferase
MKMTQNLWDTMTRILKNIVDEESRDANIDGILVFGSYVKQTLHENSDLDTFVLDSSHNSYQHMKKIRHGIMIEFNRWPTHFFQRILYSNRANIYPKAFLFKILTEGNIEYDPNATLQKARIYAKTHELPQTSIYPLLQRTRDSLKFASKHIDRQRNLLAEIEIRISSENLARLFLLKKKILDINPPKYYLPSLRKSYPHFFTVFCAIHNLQTLKSIQIEKNIRLLRNWIYTLHPQYRDPSLIHAISEPISLTNAEIELANAEDCLRYNSLEAAELQTRYSALYLAALILNQNDTMINPHQIITRLLQSNHAYRRVFLSILNCNKESQKLRCYLEYLIQLESKLASIKLS